MTNEQLTIFVSVLCTLAPLLSLLLAYFVAKRNKEKDMKKEAEEYGALKVDLRYIREGIDDLKRSQATHDEKLDTLSERMARVEEKVDSHIKDRNIHVTHSKKRSTKKS